MGFNNKKDKVRHHITNAQSASNESECQAWINSSLLAIGERTKWEVDIRLALENLESFKQNQWHKS